MPYADASNVILLRADEERHQDGGRSVGQDHWRAAWQCGRKHHQGLRGHNCWLPRPETWISRTPSNDEHYPEAYQDLLNKRVDAVVNSRSTMMVVMRDAPGKFKMIGGVSDITAYFGMAFRKEDTALRDFVNTQLAAMKQDGTLGKLQEKWFGGTMETPNTVPEILP